MRLAITRSHLARRLSLTNSAMLAVLAVVFTARGDIPEASTARLAGGWLVATGQCSGAAQSANAGSSGLGRGDGAGRGSGTDRPHCGVALASAVDTSVDSGSSADLDALAAETDKPLSCCRSCPHTRGHRSRRHRAHKLVAEAAAHRTSDPHRGGGVGYPAFSGGGARGCGPPGAPEDDLRRGDAFGWSRWRRIVTKTSPTCSSSRC